MHTDWYRLTDNFLAGSHSSTFWIFLWCRLYIRFYIYKNIAIYIIWTYSLQQCLIFWFSWFGLWCLKALSTIFQLLQSIAQKTKDRATWITLKTGYELRCSGRMNSFCSIYDIRRVDAKRHEHHLSWKSCWTPVYVNKYKLHRYTWTLYNTNWTEIYAEIVADIKTRN